MSAPQQETIDQISRTVRRVVPVNTSVGGRARLAVHGLLRNPLVRSFLEAELSGIHGIRGVSANVSTGNILVLYEGLSLEAIVLDVEMTLDRSRCQQEHAQRLTSPNFARYAGQGAAT
jgi:Heavy metal associated domain 2